MIEIYQFVMLSILLLVTVLCRGALPAWMQTWQPIWQTGALLFVFLCVYAIGLLMVELASRGLQRRLPVPADDTARLETARRDAFGGLAWPGHLLIVALAILSLAIPIGEQVPHSPMYIALLGLACIAILSRFVLGWLELHRAPLPASNLQLESDLRCVNITWTLPADPLCAECLLVRTPATSMPSHPKQGDVLYRGVLSRWRDETVQSGVAYLYTVFTHDGLDRYVSTMGKTCSALPLPASPRNLTYIPDRKAIQLRWRLEDPVHAIQIIRRTVGTAAKDTTSLEIGPRESWRDGGLSSGVCYEYNICSVDPHGQLSEPARILAATLAEPLTAFNAQLTNRNQVRLTWVLPTEAVDLQYVVVTRVKDQADQAPVEIFTGIDSEHMDYNLEYGTTYLYTIEASYTPSTRSEPLSERIVTGSRPSSVHDIEVESKRRVVHLRWSLPEDESVSQVRLSRLEYSPADNDWAEHELLSERVTEYIDEDVEPGTHYTYWLYVQASDGHWSEPKRVDTQTLPPPPAVSEVKATRPDSGSPVTLTWRPCEDGTVIGTHVVRHRNRHPGSPQDGEIVHHGPGTKIVDESVEVNQLYYYALYTYDSQEVYSPSVFERVFTHPIITFWVHYPDLKKRQEVRLPSGVTVGEAAHHLLRKEGLNLRAGDAWTATIEETGQVVAAGQSLRDVGIQHDQTIRLEHEERASVVESATDETGETATRPIPDDEKLTLWIRYPDLDNKREQVRLPANLRMHPIAANRLSRQGVNLKTVSAWEAIIEESGRVIKPEESLGDAGIQTGETVCLIFEIAREHSDENGDDEEKNE